MEKEPIVAIPLSNQCDPARPHSPHPTDCYKFYHCVNRPNGVQQVEKTCNPPTMFNPNTMICDWPQSVMRIRPECGLSNVTTQVPVLPPTLSSSAALEKAPIKPVPIKSVPLKAICTPPCQNLGFCKAPNVCICPEIFEGPQCQFTKSKPCVEKPPTPKNSRIVCNSTACTSTCNIGFTFPGGSKEIQMVCDSGNWVQLQQPQGTVQKVADCQPVCDPVCENGGRCLPNNVCLCPEEFRGPQCKYPLKNCAPERLNFNGGYNCSIGSTLYRCTLKCGANGVFEFPPAPFYTCDFAKAKFTPEPIPKCISESQYAQNLKSKPTSAPQILIEQNSELKGNFQQSSNLESEWFHPTTVNPNTASNSKEASKTSSRIPGRCDPARPHSPHPTSCYLFYHCVDGVSGIVYLEKACQPPTMFNPDTMICDWPESVMRIRPCGSIVGSIPTSAPITATKKVDTARSCVDGWTDWFSASVPAENSEDFELYEQIAPQGSICPTSKIREIEHQVRFRCNCGEDASLPLKQLPELTTSEKVVTTLRPVTTEKVINIVTTTTPTSKKIAESCPKGYTWSRCAYICTRLCSTYAVELKKQGRCQTSNDLSCAPGCVEEDETLDRTCLWRDKFTCVPPTECIAAPTQQLVPKG
ncbi:uncharacterized protein LOC124191084 isoform X2 [Daphnia pulex]|nr:uncharacterized protein LOC124191084 isoform X2 [Daphnia pulex]XP_046440027.1 uncharacterized protein LOC124191084 isoform X2 [Daphnia pulex]